MEKRNHYRHIIGKVLEMSARSSGTAQENEEIFDITATILCAERWLMLREERAHLLTVRRDIIMEIFGENMATGGNAEVIEQMGTKIDHLWRKDYYHVLKVIDRSVCDSWRPLQHVISVGATSEDVQRNHIEWLIRDKGVKSIAKDGYTFDGKTLLHQKCEKKDLEVVQCLIEQGKALLEERDLKGYTPLHYAAWSGHEGLVQYLIGQGVNVNQPSYHKEGGLTPLHCACEIGSLGVVRLLVGGGAYVNVRDAENLTPLSYACTTGRLDIITFLVQEHNASVLEPDISHACTEGHRDIVEYFFHCYEDVLKHSGDFLFKAINGHIERGRGDLEEEDDISEERGVHVAQFLIDEMSKKGVYEARRILIDKGLYNTHLQIENPFLYQLIENKLTSRAK